MNNDQEEIIMYRNHENKHKIRSPPNKFIIENNYEHSPEKFSLSDNGTSMEIDSFRNCLKLEKVKYTFNIKLNRRKKVIDQKVYYSRKNILSI